MLNENNFVAEGPLEEIVATHNILWDMKRFGNLKPSQDQFWSKIVGRLIKEGVPATKEARLKRAVQ